jgi:formate dehydrogenase iron-sulfur subunit
VIGLLGLFCSVMIYVDTRRPFWRIEQTGPRFFGAAVVLGSAVSFGLSSDFHYALCLIATLLCKLAGETRCLRVLDTDDDHPTPERQTALILTGPLRRATALRYLSALAALALALFLLRDSSSGPLRLALLSLALLSEGTERYLYFRAVFAPKMPGVVTA